MSNPTPTLVVYKEIVEADLLKLLAQSNVTASGGGARDLRLPASTFRQAMHRIFTRPATGTNGKPVWEADVLYLDTRGEAKTTVLVYWHSTESRSREDRVARVHASPALGGSRLPAQDRGRVFVLFMLFSDGTVRCEYAYEDDLRSGVWAEELSSAILNCVEDADATNARRTKNLVSVQGHYDFADGTHFCHAS